MNITKNIYIKSAALSVLFIFAGCKVGKKPVMEVPKQEYSCESSLCRTVDKPTECQAGGGIWNESTETCQETVEYQKWQCVISSGEWSPELEKCNPTDEELEAAEKDKSDDVTDENKSLDDILPGDKSKEDTKVDIDIEIVE